MSLVVFLRDLSPKTRYREAGLYLGALIVLWTVTSVLTVAFQCKLPYPWQDQNNTCLNQVSPHIARYKNDYAANNIAAQTAFETYVAVANAVTDLGLVVLPISIIVPTQIPLKRKLAILFAFTARFV